MHPRLGNVTCSCIGLSNIGILSSLDLCLQKFKWESLEFHLRNQIYKLIKLFAKLVCNYFHQQCNVRKYTFWPVSKFQSYFIVAFNIVSKTKIPHELLYLLSLYIWFTSNFLGNWASVSLNVTKCVFSFSLNIADVCNVT